MKILFYNDYSKRIGGAETYWIETSRQLRNRGLDVLQYSFEWETEYEHKSGSRLFNLFSAPDKRLAQQLKETISAYKPDIFHVNKNCIYASTIKCVADSLHIPVVTTIHDYYSVPFSTNWKGRLKTALFQSTKYPSHYIVPSSCYYSVLSEAKVMNLHFVPHFVDTELWKFNTGGFRKENELLYIGRLEQLKGIYVLLDAMYIVAKKFPFVRLTIIGQGSEKAGIEKAIKRLGLSKNIELAGQKTQAEIQQYFDKSAILVIPSLMNELFGLVGLEAQACGVPVIATRVGGIHEWCRHEETGITIPPGNPVLLAENIIALIDAPDKCQALALNARKFVEQHFNPETAVHQLMNCYSTLLAHAQH